jgi:hypothetical protein
MRRTRSGLSVTTIAIGTAVTAGSAVAAYFYAESASVLAALLITMSGITMTLILDHRVKLAEIERLVVDGNTTASIGAEVERLARIDDVFRIKHAELQSEMADLARGIYRIRTLTSLYQDDIRSIERLRSGDILLSTCPVTPASTTEAMRQVTTPEYKESMRAHLDAVKRGVQVTRIYLLRDIDLFLHPPLTKHLLELEKGGLDIRVILRDQTILDGRFDFLVFGSTKVSVGVAEPGAGTVSGAIVYTDPITIRTHVDEYSKLRVMSTKASTLLATHETGVPE